MFRTSISVAKAKELIEQHDLTPIGDLWHYSFNIDLYVHMHFEEDNGKIQVYASQPFNEWSPWPIFTNYKIELEKASSSKPFWFCMLTTFEDFLNRRTALSKNPHKHFPSNYTFQKKHEELKGNLKICNLCSKIFIDVYNVLRRQGHWDGKTLLELINKANPKIPPEWFKMMLLTIGDRVAGIGLVVDDGRSQSLLNLASEINPNRIGLYMLALWVKYCCFTGKKSIDAGVSGTYGVYKSQIFLDSVNAYGK